MSIKKYIPNLLTCGNIACGLAGIIVVMSTPAETLGMPWLMYLIGGALVFDFLDGFAARLLKAYSPIGKELDSLADMVSFGVLPGLILFQLLNSLLPSIGFDRGMLSLNGLLPYVSFLIPIFSAIRLAKFNIDTRQSDSFIGLPTPANTLFILGVAYSYTQKSSFLNPFINPISISIICFVLSYLLIAEIPLIALKFKNTSWAANKFRYLLIISAITLFLILNFNAIPIIIILYIILSLVNRKGIDTTSSK